MSYRPPPDEPAIRIVTPAGDAPLAPRPSRFTLLAAAAIGAAVGFLIGGVTTGVGSGERSPTTEPFVAGDLAEPGADLAPVTTVAATTAPTATTTAGTSAPAATLGDVVPGLDGTLLVAFPDAEEWWEWQADSPQPTRLVLPPDTTHAAWNADGTSIAAIGGTSGDRVLFLNDGSGFLPVFLGVGNFAWHDTNPGRIAWLTQTGDRVLHAANVEGSELGFQLTARVETLGPGADLAAWGAWGFAFSDNSAGEDGGARVVTVDQTGDLIGDLHFDLVGSRPDGLLFIQGADGQAAVTTAEFANVTPLGWTVEPPMVWAPSGVRAATVVDTALSAALQVDQLERRGFRSILGVADATPLGWAGGDRFAVMWTTDAGELVPRGGGGGGPVPALIFVDLADRSTHAVPVIGRPSAIAVRP